MQAQDEARSLLRAYRHLRPKDDDTFGIVTSDSLVNLWNQLTGAIAATAVGVVSVFMVVGGVVIMNIMLAVVTERTHEIGIRKSVGARRQDILNQFLVESSMLSAIGGLMGVMLAWIVAVLVRNLTPVPMAVPITAVIVGVRSRPSSDCSSASTPRSAPRGSIRLKRCGWRNNDRRSTDRGVAWPSPPCASTSFDRSSPCSA